MDYLLTAEGPLKDKKYGVPSHVPPPQFVIMLEMDACLGRSLCHVVLPQIYAASRHRVSTLTGTDVLSRTVLVTTCEEFGVVNI